MRFVLIIVLMMLSFPGMPLAAQRTRTVVSGRVLNASGHPRAGVQVYVERPATRGVITDSLGRFVIADFSPGSHLVHAALIGHQAKSQAVLLQAGDSVFVTFQLDEIVLPFPGSDIPYPDSARIELAIPLLPRLLRDSAVTALIAQYVTADTLIVWVHWQPPGNDRVLGSDPVLRLVGRCEDCVARTSFTVEGGRQYTAGVSHLNVGLADTGFPGQLQFCVKLMDGGELAMLNCGGPKAVTVLYEHAVFRR